MARRRVPIALAAPERALRYLEDLTARSPEILDDYDDYCERAGEPEGVVRDRWGRIYDTVFISFDGAGAPSMAQNILYTNQLSATVAGIVKTARHTNLREGSKLVNSQAFKALAHGFELYIQTPPTALDPAEVLQAFMDIEDALFATFGAGTQNTQIWGPIATLAAGRWAQNAARGSQAAGVDTAIAAPPNKARDASWHALDPEYIFEAGANFSIEIGGVTSIPTVAGIADMVVGVRHTYVGTDYVQVPG